MVGLHQGHRFHVLRHQGVQVRWYAVPFLMGMLCFRFGDAVLWVWVWVWGCNVNVAWFGDGCGMG